MRSDGRTIFAPKRGSGIKIRVEGYRRGDFWQICLVPQAPYRFPEATANALPCPSGDRQSRQKGRSLRDFRRSVVSPQQDNEKPPPGSKKEHCSTTTHVLHAHFRYRAEDLRGKSHADLTQDNSGKRETGFPELPEGYGSDTFQVLDQVGLVALAEVQAELLVVVIDHVEQGGEAAVMIEAALLVRPQAGQRSRAVHVRG